MVDFAKPTKIPEWADTGVIVEPSEAKKDSGWVAPELPPDTFFNWHMNLVGQWVKWLDERLLEGTGPEDLTIAAPAGATDGGDLLLNSGAPGVVTGDGGAVAVTSGAGGATSGDAGDISMQSGAATGGGSGGGMSLTAGAGTTVGGAASLTAGAGTAGDGGAVAITSGVGTSGDGGAINIHAANGDIGGAVSLTAGNGNPGGKLDLEAGDSLVSGAGAQATIRGGSGKGLNVAGGDALVTTGSPTGNQSADTILQAAGGGSSGTFFTPPEDYLRCDGADQRINALKRIEASYSGSDRGPVRVVPRSGLPTTGIAAGEVAVDSAHGDKLQYYDGTVWEKLAIKDKVAVIDATQLVADGEFDNSALVIPANKLRVGDIIRLRFAGEANPTALTNYAIHIRLNGTTNILSCTMFNSVGNLIHWSAEAEFVVTSIGGAGKLRGGMTAASDEGSTSPNATADASSGITIDTTAAATFECRFTQSNYGTADCFVAIGSHL